MMIDSEEANIPVDPNLDIATSEPQFRSHTNQSPQQVDVGLAATSRDPEPPTTKKAQVVVETSEPQGPMEMDWSFLHTGKLYGRQQELAQFREAFYRRVSPAFEEADDETKAEIEAEIEIQAAPSASSELVLVSGQSGTGKTVLTQISLQELATKHGGYYIMGKFDQLQIPEPYAPFVAALTQLVILLEAQGEDKLQDIRRKVLTEAGPDACSVLRALIPSFARAFGASRGDTGAWAGRDNQQNRLKIAMRKFLRSICSVSQPLVLVLDDLQWADAGSLSLLESIVSEENIEGLLVVGICRSDEVSVYHDFAGMLRHLEDKKGTRITHIEVKSLSMEATNALLADVMRQPPDACKTLAEIMHDKTNGNVFFILQFLKALYEEGVLVAERRTEDLPRHQSQWLWHDEQWDLHFHAAKLNVVELVSRHLKRLPESYQLLLRTAAFMGAEFEDDIIRAVLEDVDISEALKQMTEEELLVERLHQPGKYAFAHDQIQRAAYSLVPEEERAILHLSIGRALYQHLSNEEVKEKIFLVVNQMVRGADLLTTETDKYGLANLCRSAGKQATKSSDFITAITYYEMGIGLLARRHWRDEYHLSLELYSSLAEAACSVANFDEVDTATDEILANARSYDDKLRAYITKVYALGARSRAREALDLGKEVLANLGEKLPARPGMFHILADLIKVKRRLRGKSDNDLLSLPDVDVNNRRKLAALTLLSMMTVYAFLGQKELFPIMSLRMIKLSLKYGLSAMSTQAFGIYGCLLVGLDEVDEGYRYSQIALRILDRYENTKAEWIPRTFTNTYGVVAIWKKPFSSVLDNVFKAHSIGRETGDLEFAMIAGYIHGQIQYLAGLPLQKIEQDLVVYVDLMEQSKQGLWMAMTNLQLQLVRNLAGKSKNPLKMTCELTDCDSALIENPNEENKALYKVLAMIHRLILSYHFDVLPLALESAKLSRLVETLVKPAPGVIIQRFYDGMTALKAARITKKRKHFRRGRQVIRMFEKMAKFCPENNLHKVYLLQAELVDLQGKHAKAADLYSQAIHNASEGGFREAKALACECYGSALDRRGNKSEAKEYLKRAVEGYEEWGAFALARSKEKEYNLIS